METATDIEQQRADLEGKLFELQTMDGLPATALIRQARDELNQRQAAIAEVQRQINEIDAETGARVRHERIEEERQRLDRQEALRRQLVELSEQRQQAIADAQSHAKSLADALHKAIKTNGAMAQCAYRLTGTPAPTNFSEVDFVRRLSAKLSGALSAGLGNAYRFRFGHLIWSGASTYPAAQDWAEAEERAITTALVSIISKKD